MFVCLQRSWVAGEWVPRHSRRADAQQGSPQVAQRGVPGGRCHHRVWTWHRQAERSLCHSPLPLQVHGKLLPGKDIVTKVKSSNPYPWVTINLMLLNRTLYQEKLNQSNFSLLLLEHCF